MTQFRSKPFLLVMALILVGMAAVRPITAASPWAGGIVASLVMVLALAAAAIDWRLRDEASREAYKAAWFWGGSLGVVAAGVLLVVLRVGGMGVPGLRGGDPLAYFGAGALTLLAAQMIGFVLWLAGWWWSKR